MCSICHLQEESIEHLILFCPWVKPIWFDGILNYKIDRSGVSSWTKWFDSVAYSQLGDSGDRLHMLSYVAFTCWHIWKAHCNLLFNRRPIDPTQVVCAINNSAGAFSANVRDVYPLPSPIPPVDDRLPRWFPLPQCIQK